jgi:hypothetical protein
MADTFSTLIVTSADADTARAIAAAFGPGGVGMWLTPLSASGSEPVTHYISSGYIPSEFVALAPSTTWTLDENGDWVASDIYPGDAAAVYGFCQQEGLPYTLAEIEGVLSRSDGSAQEPFTAMGRLGLKIINPSEIL